MDQPDTQIILLDTPGIHEPHDSLGETVVERARESWTEGDLILHVVDAPQGWTEEDAQLRESLSKLEQPTLLVPNKIDQLNDSLQEITDRYVDHAGGTTVVPVSARTGRNTQTLLDVLRDRLPRGPRLFPGDNPTDRSRKFLSAEIIREKTIEETYQEVPHSLEVTIDSVGPGDDPEITVVNATIHVERDSQKGIVIGQGGKKIRSIGMEARPELEDVFSSKIYLDLTVDVMKDWTDKPKSIQKLTRQKTRISP